MLVVEVFIIILQKTMDGNPLGKIEAGLLETKDIIEKKEIMERKIAIAKYAARLVLDAIPHRLEESWKESISRFLSATSSETSIEALKMVDWPDSRFYDYDYNTGVPTRKQNPSIASSEIGLVINWLLLASHMANMDLEKKDYSQLDILSVDSTVRKIVTEVAKLKFHLDEIPLPKVDENQTAYLGGRKYRLGDLPERLKEVKHQLRQKQIADFLKSALDKFIEAFPVKKTHYVNYKEA